jgi:5-formyltetrahydrofolate cyclo-ligase
VVPIQRPSEPPAKAALRALARRRRDALAEAVRAAHSQAASARAVALLAAARPKAIAAYGAFSSEADPAAAVAWAEGEGIEIGLPAMVDAATMAFRRRRRGEALAPDALSIAAPGPDAPVVIPDAVIVPLTAFDRTGTRLGKGYGIYDRWVSAERAAGRDPLLIGLAFSVQEVDAIPAEPHDIRLHHLVTERETLTFAAPPKGRT